MSKYECFIFIEKNADCRLKRVQVQGYAQVQVQKNKRV
jgi:hypothetical protein